MEQCVMTHGTMRMPLLCADNLASLLMVTHYKFHTISTNRQLFRAVHFSGFCDCVKNSRASKSATNSCFLPF